MERQLANLTGLVQKALTHAPHASPSPRDYLQVPAPRDPYRTTGKKAHPLSISIFNNKQISEFILHYKGKYFSYQGVDYTIIRYSKT